MSVATATKKRPSQTKVSTEALDDYDIHDAANMFPLIDADSLQALADDIREHGQQEPIWMFKGQLLDGRNRVLACALAKIKPIRQEWKPKPGESPTQFVMSRNLHRRHLTASQRAALAVELEAVIAEENKRRKTEAKKDTAAPSVSFTHSGKAPVALSSTGDTSVQFTSGDPDGPARVGTKVRTGRARDQAAQTLNVSAGYVNDAKDLKKADPDLFDQVKSGDLTLTRAQDQLVGDAQKKGTLSEVSLRPGAVRAAMERLDAENAPKKPTKAPPIKLPKASKVQSSATSLSITVTFGNQTVAEEWLNRMQEDKRVLDLDYEVLDKRPRKKKSAAKTA